MRWRNVTRLLPILLIVGGCATTPTPDPWATLETPRDEPTQPVALPDWPIPYAFDDTSATWNLEGIQALDAYRVAAEANQAIAAEHAAQIEDLQDALQALVEAGQAQRVIADMRLEMLEDERRHHAWEKGGLYAIIVALGIAAIE